MAFSGRHNCKRQFMHKNQLYELIFFVTSRCNSNCRHCFNRSNLNNNLADLSLEKINDLAGDLPAIDNLLLSGGEPFLRPDLAELIKIFRANNNIKTVSIPTNGLLTDSIVDECAKILAIEGLRSVSVNLSLDGLAKTHDQIRGVKGNFEKVLNTLKELKKLKEKNSKLNILINSVIVKDNYQELFNLFEYLENESAISNHFFEIMRPELKSAASDKPQDHFISKSFYSRALSLQYGKFKIDLKTKNFIKRFLHEVNFLGKMALIYNLQLSNFNNNKVWPFFCQAGKNILVMNCDGRVRPCELRDKTFSLSENFKNKKLVVNSELERELESIKKQKCYCTHFCFIDASINASLYARYFLIPFFGLLNYIKYEYFGYRPNL